MGIGREKIEPVSTHLRGFSRKKVLPLGSIQLVLTLGKPPCQATTTTRFLIVDAPSAYNMLLGRPSLNAIKAIPSAYHMVIKFPTINGVGTVRGDQRVARECYTASMKQKAVDNVSIGELLLFIKTSPAAHSDELSSQPRGTSSYIHSDEPFTVLQIDRLLPTILLDELSLQHRRTSPYCL